MPSSPYIVSLREKIGRDLLMLPSVAVMVFDAQGRLLLAKENQTGRWMTIGGAIDPKEAPADAAVREAFEETGLMVEPVRLIGVVGGPRACITYGNGDEVNYTAIVFEARIVGGQARPDGVETVELRYFTQAEAAALELSPHTREIVDQSFKREARAYFARPRWQPT